MVNIRATLGLIVRGFNTAYLIVLFAFMVDDNNFDETTVYKEYIEVYSVVYLIVEAVGFLMSIMISIGWLHTIARSNTPTCLVFLVVALLNYSFLIATAVFMFDGSNFSEYAIPGYRYTLGAYSLVAVIMNVLVSDITCNDREQTCILAIV